ncbi:hypothetical protein [Levilactobacillus paucivorans]|uniref:hypothetical protein n=1 Tax=Levilactobacillus paucivorans TaxID=616990 RepID=UPI00070B0F53|nr:hypothetical protein [Levilactobacillus paucivorans]
MKIIDKGSHAPVTKCSVGDVIQDDSSTYMIVRTLSDNYALVDLGDGYVSDGYGSLKELYHETYVSGDRKVKATLVIEGEES